MFCKKCGNRFSGSFCGNCGSAPSPYDDRARHVSGAFAGSSDSARARHIRAGAVVLTVLIIVSMLLGWIVVRADVQNVTAGILPQVLPFEFVSDRQTGEDIFSQEYRQIYTIYDLHNIALTLNLLLDTTYFAESLGTDWVSTERVEIISELIGTVPDAMCVATEMLDVMVLMARDGNLGAAAIIGQMRDGGSYTSE